MHTNIAVGGLSLPDIFSGAYYGAQRDAKMKCDVDC